MSKLMWLAAISVSAVTLLQLHVSAQSTESTGTAVSVVITAEAKRGSEIPILSSSDIGVREGRDSRPVTGVEPLTSQAGQLLLMIDDSARGTFDTEIPALKSFINALPPEMEVGVDYMRNGTNQVASAFTRDHASAAHSIRIALGAGGADVSPYDSLSDAIKHWPTKEGLLRREVVMISSGVEGLGGGLTTDNPYVEAGITEAQKAGIIVYSIYSPSVGHEGHSFWRSTWGQNFLSQMSDETGGESYIIGFGSPVSFEPYLNDILKRQRQQYVVTFLARAENKAGLQAIKIAVREKDASLAAPDRVYVRAGL